MSGSAARWGVLSLVWLSLAAPARAQLSDPSLAGRFEVSGGVGWWGGYSLGETSAVLPSQGATLYEADASVDGGGAATARFGWRFWRTLTLEGGATWSRATLHSTVRSDVEPALNASLDTPFKQLAAELGISQPLRRAAWRGGRIVPFFAAGGGYLRQLYEDGVLLETGRFVYGGGGVRLGSANAKPDRFLKHVGLRADLRFVVRSGGIDVDDSLRTFVIVMGGAFVRF